MSPTPLADLVNALRHDVMHVSVVGDPAHAVHDVELLDCESSEAGGFGHLLLAVGLDVGSPATVDAALRVAASSASALAVKTPGPLPQEFLTRARAAGVTVVSLDPRVSWSRVQRLASTLLATHPGGDADDPHSGGDLFALANSVAAIVGGAVAIMDTSQVIVAYSNLPDQPIDETRRRGILGRRVPADALPDHLAQEVWRSDSVVRHQREGDLHRLAMVIRAGADVLGSLWVSFADEPVSTDCESTLQQAARVAALHMLALRRQFDADQDSRNRAFRDALDQTDPRPAGLRLPAILLGADAPGPPDTRATNLLRVLDLFGLDGRALGHQPALALRHDRIYALLPSQPAGTVPVTALIAHLRDRAARTLHIEVTIVSDEVGTPAALHHARQDIDTSLDHLRETGAAPGHYTTDELRTELVRKRLLDAVRDNPLLRTGAGERITAHDREHTTEFAATLLTYLRQFGNVATASEALHIHQNTLRQRLRRARELFDLDLDNPALHLLLEIELAAATAVPRS
jgi:hypothetical protein